MEKGAQRTLEVGRTQLLPCSSGRHWFKLKATK